MAFSKMSSLGGDPAGGDGFDPNQPRIPAGQPGGGQWTSLGGLLGGGIMRAGEEEGPFGEPPPSSKVPDDAVRLARMGSEANSIVVPQARPGLKPPAFRTGRPVHAFTIFEAWSALNGPDGYAVLELHSREPRFNAFQFTRPAEGEFVFNEATVERLTREQVRKKCNQFEKVQKALDVAYEGALKENPAFSRGQLGTRMHLNMKRTVDAAREEAEQALKRRVDEGVANAINALGNPDLKGVFLEKESSEKKPFDDPSRLAAERSYMRGQPEPEGNKNYAAKGSRRPDLVERSFSIGAGVERVKPDTACIYQHSIGQKEMSLDPVLSLGEITREAFRNDNFKHFIVIQTRPSQWRPGR